MIKAAILAWFCLSLGLSWAFADTDPLFAKMVGQWSGHGTRLTLPSGAEVQIDAQVKSALTTEGEESVLVSENHITETAADGSTRVYDLEYWIKGGQSGRYLLGKTGSPAVMSLGNLDSEGIFWTKETVSQGDRPVVLRSRTVFSPDQADYTEILTSGNQAQTETAIHYQRSAQ